MSIVQTMPRRPLGKRIADGLAQWAVCAPLAVVACLVMRRFDPPGVSPTAIEVMTVFALFSVFSFALGSVLARGADNSLRDDSSAAQFARALYLLAPAWLIANAIAYAWAVFILVGVIGIAAAGWRTLLH